MNTVSKSFYSDLKAAKTDQAKAKKPYSITRLTKAGKPSKMASDTLHFSTVSEALDYIERIKDLNPTTIFNWQYSETMREELHSC